MNIFEVFEKLSVDQIDDYIAKNQEEHLHLDFKTVRDVSFESADDKRNLARALSGFANSSGGLIVWGVEARKNSDGIDCATALKEIDRVAVLLSRLNQLTGDGVDPTVLGVRHRIIPGTGKGKGFAVSLVPESDTGPHMAKLGEDRYYKRSGDSFYKMEHYDISEYVLASSEAAPCRNRNRGGFWLSNINNCWAFERRSCHSQSTLPCDSL